MGKNGIIYEDDKNVIEEYTLTGSNGTKKGVPAGVLLMYVFLKDYKYEPGTIKLGKKGKNLDDENLFVTHCMQVAQTPESLAEVFRRVGADAWAIRGYIGNNFVLITGSRDTRKVRILYQKDDEDARDSFLKMWNIKRTPVDCYLMTRMTSINSWNYHDFDPIKFECVRENLGLGDWMTQSKNAVKWLQSMQAYPDIFEELMEAIGDDGVIRFPENNAVCADGYTAERIWELWSGRTDANIAKLDAYEKMTDIRSDPDGDTKDYLKFCEKYEKENHKV